MYKNRNAQTATEYMVIVAVVIVIALVVVQIMGGFPGIGSGTSKKVSDYKLSTEDKVGISNYYFGNGFVLATLKNNHFDSIQVVNVTIRGVDCISSNTNLSGTNYSAFILTLNAGQSTTINCTGDFNLSDKDEGTPSLLATYIDSATGASYTATSSGKTSKKNKSESENISGTISWNQTFGGSAYDDSWGILTDSSGNVYVNGETDSYGVGSGDFWTGKYDSNGNMLWNRTFGGTELDYAMAMAKDASGNIYVTGGVDSFGALFGDIYIVKYDSNGNLFWNRSFGGSGTEMARGITIDSSGNIIVGGQTDSFGAGSIDILTLKYDSSGNLLWNRTFGGTDWEMADGVVTDSLGNVYLTAYYRSGGAGSTDILTLKYDSSGNLLWNKTFGGTDQDGGSGIAIDTLGNIYVTGFVMSFGIGGDVIILKYDSNGNQIWNRTFGGTDWDFGSTLVTDSSGNIYVAGDTYSFGNGGDDYLVIKYDTNGNQIWNKTYGGPYDDSAYGIALDSSGNIYVTGQIDSLGDANINSWTIKINH